MKKLGSFWGILLSFCMLCISLFGCATTTTSSTASAEELSYVSMRINPEIELVVDEDGEVVAVNAVNEDGETVLTQIDLIGMTVEAAGEAFTATATELGFLDVNSENATVYVLADGENEELVEQIEKKIEDKIHEFFDKKGIFGRVSKEDLQEFDTLATEWNVSKHDAKMISRILELYPEMTVEEILELSFEERLQLIKDDTVKNGLTADMREAHKEAVEALKIEYAELFTIGERIRELKVSLKNQELSEDEKAAIQAELDGLKAQYETLKAQFEEALNALKAQWKQGVAAKKEAFRQHAEERRGEFEQRIEEHKQRFEQNMQEIGEQIKKWREQR